MQAKGGQKIQPMAESSATSGLGSPDYASMMAEQGQGPAYNPYNTQQSMQARDRALAGVGPGGAGAQWATPNAGGQYTPMEGYSPMGSGAAPPGGSWENFSNDYNRYTGQLAAGYTPQQAAPGGPSFGQTMGMPGNASQVPQQPRWGQQMANAGYSMPPWYNQAVESSMQAQAPQTQAGAQANMGVTPAGTNAVQGNPATTPPVARPEGWDAAYETQPTVPTRINQWGRPDVAWGSKDSAGRLLVDPHAETKKAVQMMLARPDAHPDTAKLARMLGVGP